MKLAVIDLGTNTCNLLIAEIYRKKFNILHQSKIGVKLGKGGINKKILTPKAFLRATSALKRHKKTIGGFNADKIIAIATSAVRDAENKLDFEAHLLKETGIKLETISGEREAELILKGVQLAFGNLTASSLIMDIGGGSNEFIELKNNELVWKESFPLGMARIIDQLSISDPITKDEVREIEAYFYSGLKNLWSQIKENSIEQLIGCSGAFDTIADLIDHTLPGTKSRQSQLIPLDAFNKIADKVIYSTKWEREQMPGMEPLRVEMIVPALIFIRFVICKLNIGKIIQTDFALREGILYEWIYD